MIIQLIVGGILLGGLYALMAMGLSLIFGVMRIVNFAHGEFVMFGMYLTFLIYTYFNLDAYIALFIVTPIMFLLGLFVNKILIKKLIGAEHVTQIFVTVGLSMLMMSLALMIFGANFLSVNSAFATQSYDIGVLIGVPQLISFLISIFVTFGMFLFLKHTLTGKAIRATTQNRSSAQLMGIDINKIYSLTFGIGIALTGLSAAIIIPIFPVYPTIGVNFVLLTFVIVVMGGMGSIPGVLLGGITIGIIETVSAFYFDLGWRQAFYFAAFLLILIIRPQGFFGQLGSEDL